MKIDSKVLATKVLAGFFVACIMVVGTAVGQVTIEFQSGQTNGLFPFGYDGAQDAAIRSGTTSGDRNDNGSTAANGRLMTVGAFPNSSEERKVLFSYDLSQMANFVGPGRTLQINSATLSLRLVRNNGSTDALIEMFAIDSANAGWFEGNKTPAAAADPGEVTWNNLAHDATPWAGSAGLSTPGTDFDPTPISSFTYPAGSTTQFWDAELPASLVLDWINNPADNAGVFIRHDKIMGVPLSDNNAINVFAAESVPFPLVRPRLTIDFTVLSSEDADFNSNGFVDGADFLAWQRGFGIASGASLAQGDANIDGAVNSADLAIWENQFGSPSPLAAISAVSAVPEPATLFSAFVAAGLLLRIRRRR